MSMIAKPKVRATREAMPPPAGFEALDQTHREVVAVLVEFDRLLQHLDDNGADAVAQASAKRICTFFAGTARQHHEDEEKLVFPGLLLSSDPDLVQNVRRLQQDHGWLEEDWHELSPQIEAIAQGYSWYDVAHLRAALPVFTALYHEHIALEEGVVYPAAKRHQQALAEGRAQRTG